MGTDDTGRQILDTLRELRDGQREMIDLFKSQQALAHEQLNRSRETVAESVDMQRLALKRQKTIVMFALPAIFACIAAIGYLVFRYF